MNTSLNIKHIYKHIYKLIYKYIYEHIYNYKYIYEHFYEHFYKHFYKYFYEHHYKYFIKLRRAVRTLLVFESCDWQLEYESYFQTKWQTQMPEWLASLLCNDN